MRVLRLRWKAFSAKDWCILQFVWRRNYVFCTWCNSFFEVLMFTGSCNPCLFGRLRVIWCYERMAFRVYWTNYVFYIWCNTFFKVWMLTGSCNSCLFGNLCDSSVYERITFLVYFLTDHQTSIYSVQCACLCHQCVLQGSQFLGIVMATGITDCNHQRWMYGRVCYKWNMGYHLPVYVYA